MPGSYSKNKTFSLALSKKVSKIKYIITFDPFDRFKKIKVLDVIEFNFLLAWAMSFVFKRIILHNSLCLLCGGGWIKSVLLLFSTNHQVCLNPLLSFLSLKLSTLGSVMNLAMALRFSSSGSEECGQGVGPVLMGRS